MAGPRAGHALVDPAGHLGERPQADDGLVPPQFAGVGAVVDSAGTIHRAGTTAEHREHGSA
jgi:hypothetical protein